MIVLYILTGLAILQGIVSLNDGWRNMRYSETYRGGETPSGSVVVFCPVKGWGFETAASVASLLEQRHPDYRVVFVTESEGDPAYGELLQYEGATVTVAGLSADRGQKVHNLAHAVTSQRGDADIFVFADADARFPPNWLADLIGPLADSSVGAATGYRWYVPDPFSIAGLLRSAWNASIAGFLGPHPNNFVWGGSTAIRAEVFERTGVLGAWEGALSDDYALTSALNRGGLGVVFVPLCLVPSHGACSWAELLEFTTRQIKITRVYAPRIWALGLTSYALFNVTFLGLLVSVPLEPSHLLALAILFLLAAVRAAFRLRGRSMAHRWFYLVSPPVVAMLYGINFLASLRNRTIEWGGVRYTMLSASRTRVWRP